MTDRDALLATVAAHPDDDLPKLVYADWLEERGDPVDVARGRFIRAQVAQAAAGWPGPARKADGYLRLYRDRWLQELPAEWRPWVGFDRGFPSGLTPDARGRADRHGCLDFFRLDAPEFRTAHWLDLCRAGYFDADDFAEMSGHAGLERVTGLDWGCYRPGPTEAVWRSPRLTGLLELDIGGLDVTDPGQADFASGRFLPALRRLELSLAAGAGDAFDGILRRPAFPQLRDLGLGYFARDGAAALAIVRSGLASPVRRLEWRTGSDGNFAADVLGQLASGDAAPDLRELIMEQDHWPAADIDGFFDALRPGRLRVLALHTYFGNQARDARPSLARRLADHPALAGLDHLDVSGLRLPVAATLDLMSAAAAAGVKRLAVRDHWDDPRFVDYLLTAAAPLRFDRLSVGPFYAHDEIGYRGPALDALRTRLGSRFVGNVTYSWLAGQRRWHPL